MAQAALALATLVAKGYVYYVCGPFPRYLHPSDMFQIFSDGSILSYFAQLMPVLPVGRKFYPSACLA
jgi:hypothetical protein